MCSEPLHQETSSFLGGWQGASLHGFKHKRRGAGRNTLSSTLLPSSWLMTEGSQAGLTCALVAGADAGTPLSGLGDQRSPPAHAVRARGPVGNSSSSLRHLPFTISSVKPSISFSEATDCVVDLEPHAALCLGSQQQTKGCRRRKHKF